MKLLQLAGFYAANIEAAVEEILIGTPWVKCPGCSGIGGFQVHDTDDKCTRCDGEGYFSRRAYEVACSVLNKEMPPKPRSNWEDREDTFAIGGLGASVDPRYYADNINPFKVDSDAVHQWGELKDDGGGGS